MITNIHLITNTMMFIFLFSLMYQLWKSDWKLFSRFKQQCNKGHYFLNLTFSTQLLYMMSVVWQLWLCNYTVWKLYHCRLLEGEDSLQLTTELLDGKVYQSLIDFDNHLDDITQDWLNKDINKVVDISPTAWIYCLVLLIFSESMTRVT